MTATDVRNEAVVTADESGVDLAGALGRQRQALLADGPPPLDVRLRNIDRLVAVLLDNADALAEAMRADFGHRPVVASLAADIVGGLQDIRYTRRHVKQWMRPRRLLAGPMALAGVRAWVEPQPLGVVGVIAPWNFPIMLAAQPAVAALAAGNRVMIKMSELTPRTAEVFRAGVAAQFSPEEVLVVTGGPEVGAAFSALPFDHLFFTGAPAVGKLVARAAAEHLVPVTLELGGKNPTVVGPDADLRMAARRTAAARMLNAGQVCLCPDYVFVPRAKLDAFVDASVDALRASYPTILGNDEYCSIVNDRHYERVVGLVADARAKGARVVEVSPSDEALPSAQQRRIPPTVLADVTDDMAVMREEIFGPVLAVLPYDSVDEAIDYISARPSPLAAYWYGGDTTDFRRFKARTRSGGLTRNDFALHMFVDGAPFGGVGNSGSGHYHGRYGFDTFSHLRGVAAAPQRFSPMAVMSPPFSPRLEKGLRWVIGQQRAAVHRRLRKAGRG